MDIFKNMFKCYNFKKKYRPVVLKLFHLTAPIYLYNILTAPKLVITKKSMVFIMYVNYYNVLVFIYLSYD